MKKSKIFFFKGTRHDCKEDYYNTIKIKSFNLLPKKALTIVSVL